MRRSGKESVDTRAGVFVGGEVAANGYGHSGIGITRAYNEPVRFTGAGNYREFEGVRSLGIRFGEYYCGSSVANLGELLFFKELLTNA